MSRFRSLRSGWTWKQRGTWPLAGPGGAAATSEHLARRAASYVDHILLGAKPGASPVAVSGEIRDGREAHNTKALGLAVPPSIMLRATEVVE